MYKVQPDTFGVWEGTYRAESDAHSTTEQCSYLSTYSVHKVSWSITLWGVFMLGWWTNMWIYTNRWKNCFVAFWKLNMSHFRDMLLTHPDFLSLKTANKADELLPCRVFSEGAGVWHSHRHQFNNQLCLTESRWRLLPFDTSAWVQTCPIQDWTVTGFNTDLGGKKMNDWEKHS